MLYLAPWHPKKKHKDDDNIGIVKKVKYAPPRPRFNKRPRTPLFVKGTLPPFNKRLWPEYIAPMEKWSFKVLVPRKYDGLLYPPLKKNRENPPTFLFVRGFSSHGSNQSIWPPIHHQQSLNNRTSKVRPFWECRIIPKKVTNKPSHWRSFTSDFVGILRFLRFRFRPRF